MINIKSTEAPTPKGLTLSGLKKGELYLHRIGTEPHMASGDYSSGCDSVVNMRTGIRWVPKPGDTFHHVESKLEIIV